MSTASWVRIFSLNSFTGSGIAFVLYVLVEVRYPPHIEALAAHPLRSDLVGCPEDAAVEGGPPEAAGEAEYPEIFMVHDIVSPVGVLDPPDSSARLLPALSPFPFPPGASRAPSESLEPGIRAETCFQTTM